MSAERIIRCEVRIKESRLSLALSALKLATSYGALKLCKSRNSKGPVTPLRAP